ncbi:hypothetical protein CBFG_04565 [Clostridiales bacterium 1_7_47FAA]|nr:hypothetical protein CBFG_04565 [Clostridiales bacterium 1_7_47FAA]
MKRRNNGEWDYYILILRPQWIGIHCGCFFRINGEYYLKLKYINGKWMTILQGRGYFVDKGTK